jgi:Protein of unknown function (DUF2817)
MRIGEGSTIGRFAATMRYSNGFQRIDWEAAIGPIDMTLIEQPAFDLSCFAADHVEARAKFLSAAAPAGALLAHYKNPSNGPNAEDLFLDTAWLGPQDAQKVLVIVSGTHGPEAFCGSGCQVDWLSRFRALPSGIALLFIHALNPFGFAWLRRQTEENVDLNRNHVDFSKPLPKNPGYIELANAFVPPQLSGPLFEAAEDRIAAYVEKHGMKAMRVARAGGQYSHPDGIFFGGVGPTWSRRTMDLIMRSFQIAERDLVCLIDYHTGLGPYGYGEFIINDPPGGKADSLANGWFGDSVTNHQLGTTSASAQQGFVADDWKLVLSERLVAGTLEFGCYALPTTHEALREEHWHHVNGFAWDDPATRQAKAKIRRAFYPDKDDWKEMVLFRSRQVLRQAITGLSSW